MGKTEISAYFDMNKLKCTDFHVNQEKFVFDG